MAKEQKAQETKAQKQTQNEVQGQGQQTIRVRYAILVFCRDLSTPMVLYFENAIKIYEDLKKVINSKEVKMVEFEPIGPIKKASIVSDRIVGVALQEERYLVQE